MARVFATARVSTAVQTTHNQHAEIAGAGFDVKPSHVISETISGSVAAGERPGFAKLLDKPEAGDVLMVTKLSVSRRLLLEASVRSNAKALFWLRPEELACAA